MKKLNIYFGYAVLNEDNILVAEFSTKNEAKDYANERGYDCNSVFVSGEIIDENENNDIPFFGKTKSEVRKMMLEYYNK